MVVYFVLDTEKISQIFRGKYNENFYKKITEGCLLRFKSWSYGRTDGCSGTQGSCR